MLVGTFQIQIGLVGFGPMRINGIFHRENMGRAGVEPDIENVGDLLIVVRLAPLAQETLRL